MTLTDHQHISADHIYKAFHKFCTHSIIYTFFTQVSFQQHAVVTVVFVGCVAPDFCND